MIVDLFMVYQFARRLGTPFKDWKAFKLGIIDADGNILKHSKDFATMAERDAFSKFDLMVLNLKKLIAKLPGGKTRVGSIAAVLYLLKEQDENVSQELFENYIIEVEGAGAPSTNTGSAIPDKIAKKSPVFKRKEKPLLK